MGKMARMQRINTSRARNFHALGVRITRANDALGADDLSSSQWRSETASGHSGNLNRAIPFSDRLQR